jgi:hypothetical protein
MQFAPFHNRFFSLNLTLHFLLSFPTWLFSPTRLTVFSGTVFRIGSPGFFNSEFSKLAIYRSNWVQNPLSSQHWLLLFQFVFIFSQYYNSFHSAIILLSSNFIIIFLIFFFLLLFLSFSFFLLFLFVFILLSYFFPFLIFILNLSFHFYFSDLFLF